MRPGRPQSRSGKRIVHQNRPPGKETGAPKGPGEAKLRQKVSLQASRRGKKCSSGDTRATFCVGPFWAVRQMVSRPRRHTAGCRRGCLLYDYTRKTGALTLPIIHQQFAPASAGRVEHRVPPQNGPAGKKRDGLRQYMPPACRISATRVTRSATSRWIGHGPSLLFTKSLKLPPFHRVCGRRQESFLFRNTMACYLRHWDYNRYRGCSAGISTRFATSQDPPGDSSVASDSPRLPLLAVFYQKYLNNQDAAAFISKAARKYNQGSLERLAVHNSPLVRRSAVLALGFLGDYEANPVLGRARSGQGSHRPHPGRERHPQRLDSGRRRRPEAAPFGNHPPQYGPAL